MSLDARQEEAGDEVSRFFLSPAVSAETMLDNMRASISRGLPVATPCRPHGLTLSVAGGGPSLADTYGQLGDVVATINGSLGFLLARGPKPGTSYLCAVMDAGEHMADTVVADPAVRYYVASVCHPALFDKLRTAGCDVRLWHISPDSTEDPAGVKAILDTVYPDEWHAIGGGCTMGLRWINLGYFLGFRRFQLHGLDSSFRGGATHAYPDRADTKDRLTFAGRETRPNFLAQVYDFFGVLNHFAGRQDAIEIEVFGDGLLQDEWRRWRERNAGRAVNTVDERTERLVRRLPEGPLIGAEVGVYQGRMSAALLAARPNMKLVMVDSWEGNGAAYLDRDDWHANLSEHEQECNMQAALRNTADAANRRMVLKMRSLEAAETVNDASLDFVFLDADHCREAVASDLHAWCRKVRSGGLLCGHDYGGRFAGVAQAVDEFVSEHNLSLETDDDTTWFIRKPL